MPAPMMITRFPGSGRRSSPSTCSPLGPGRCRTPRVRDWYHDGPRGGAGVRVAAAGSSRSVEGQVRYEPLAPMVALPSALFSFGHVKVPETVLPLVVIPIVHSPAFDRNAT